MTTLPNLFSTTMALPASDPSGSSSATLADASTVFPSFSCRSVTSPSKCVPRIPIVATAMVIRHVFPLLARNEPAHESKRPFEDPGLKGLLILLSVIDRRLAPGPPAHRQDGRARSGYHWSITRRNQTMKTRIWLAVGA